MKTALLVCDHVHESLLDEHGDYVKMFTRLLPELELTPFYVCDREFPASGKFHNYLCTGSSFSVYQNISWIKQLKQLTKEIHDSNKKFFGVCFGHQMLGLALGAEVRKSEKGFLIGTHQFDLITQNQVETEYNILMMCQDQVMTLPHDSELLASSKYCKIGMFRSRNSIGIQGHPEFSRDYNLALARLRSNLMTENSIIQAEKSMDLEISTGLFRKWILNLFSSQKF